MKIILSSLLLLGSLIFTSGQIVTNQPARLKTKVVCYAGKIGSGVSGTSICPSPELISPGDNATHSVTSPGYESDLKWVFLGRNGDKDVYRFGFTRRTKANSPDKTTTSKEVSFEGRRIIVFEDDLHAVIIESPSEQDLKTSK
jgi:hypothetical protein